MKLLKFLPIFLANIFVVLKPLFTDWNQEKRSDAQSLLLAMSQFPFTVAPNFPQIYTKGLSKKLQGRYIDVVRAHQDTESIQA